MATARDIIESSMRLLGVLATGEAAQASEASDALDSLNDMLDSWSNENFVVNAVTAEEFTLTAGQSSYTMGTGGDFNTTRPLEIIKALLQEQGSSPKFELPMRIVTPKEYASITVKDTDSTIPTYIYKEGTYPLETLKLYPVPSEANKLVLYTLKPLTTFTNLSTDASFPPGYLRALKYNLAMEIGPEYGKEASASVVQIAMESKAEIKRQNFRPQISGCDNGTLRDGAVFNWLTGEV